MGAAAGIALDEVFGEPTIDPHPVAAFGMAITHLEALWWRDDRRRGIAHAAIGVGAAAAIGTVCGQGAVGTAGTTYLSVAGRALGEAAVEVARGLEAGELDAARRSLPSLVGRDPSRLDEAEIARAVVESVAENTVDAVVAPTLWGAVAGGAGALGYRAANTLDAMVGHRSERHRNFGWASARLDDVANLVPARLTAGLVIACRPSRRRAVLSSVRRDAPAHPSPNAGVAEAAFAAALGIRLGGTNTYGERTEDRGQLGEGPSAAAVHIRQAVQLSRDVGRLLAATLASGALALSWRARR